jgi:hypothetical protein
MLKRISKYFLLILTLTVVSTLFWFKFILTEFDEFKNSTFFEHRKHISTDGPYFLDEGDSIHFIEVKKNGREFEVLSEKIEKEKLPHNFTVTTYSYDSSPSYSFEVELMDSLNTPQSEYALDGEIFAVSDIEGDFYAFQKLLKSANVIDDNFDWIFDDNHLVCIGDFVDRGLNVTQSLWLIYKLEKQAELQGGSVHFINGNHELLNLAGKIHHVRSKYTLLSQNIGLDYSTDLLGEKSELGKWLRTKNVVEKINGNLFAHAGISPALIDLNVSLETINTTVKAHYGKAAKTFSQDSLASFLYSTDGPFWYRKNTRGVSVNIQEEMNDIITYFKIERLIIGHSTMADIVGSHNNTLFNIDVHFPNSDKDSKRGMGLLIDGDNIYKIDDLGNKIQLN